MSFRNKRLFTPDQIMGVQIIYFDMPKEVLEKAGDWKNLEDRPFRAEWFTEEIVKFYDTLYPVWEKVQKQIN